MKYASLAMLIALTACSSISDRTSDKSGTGFGSYTAPTTSNAPVTANFAAGMPTRQGAYPSASMMSAGGIPMYNYISPELQKTGRPLTGRTAATRSLQIGDKQLAALKLDTIPVTVKSKSAELRRIDVDGQSYGVVANIKQGMWGGLGNSSANRAEVASFVAAKTGCSATGAVMVRNGSYGPNAFSVALNC